MSISRVVLENNLYLGQEIICIQASTVWIIRIIWPLASASAASYSSSQLWRVFPGWSRLSLRDYSFVTTYYTATMIPTQFNTDWSESILCCPEYHQLCIWAVIKLLTILSRYLNRCSKYIAAQNINYLICRLITRWGVLIQLNLLMHICKYFGVYTEYKHFMKERGSSLVEY